MIRKIFDLFKRRNSHDDAVKKIDQAIEMISVIPDISIELQGAVVNILKVVRYIVGNDVTERNLYDVYNELRGFPKSIEAVGDMLMCQAKKIAEERARHYEEIIGQMEREKELVDKVKPNNIK